MVQPSQVLAPHKESIVTSRLLLAAARIGNEQAYEALVQAGYDSSLSPGMKAIALDTALELFDEFQDEISEAGRSTGRHFARLEAA